MRHAAPLQTLSSAHVIPAVITIRHDMEGYGIRFGLTEPEDELMRGPVFETLPEAVEWIDAVDREREQGIC